MILINYGSKWKSLCSNLSNLTEQRCVRDVRYELFGDIRYADVVQTLHYDIYRYRGAEFYQYYLTSLRRQFDYNYIIVKKTSKYIVMP